MKYRICLALLFLFAIPVKSEIVRNPVSFEYNGKQYSFSEKEDIALFDAGKKLKAIVEKTIAEALNKDGFDKTAIQKDEGLKDLVSQVTNKILTGKSYTVAFGGKAITIFADRISRGPIKEKKVTSPEEVRVMVQDCGLASPTKANAKMVFDEDDINDYARRKLTQRRLSTELNTVKEILNCAESANVEVTSKTELKESAKAMGKVLEE